MIVKQLNSRLMDQLRLTRDNFANVLIDEVIYNKDSTTLIRTAN